MNIRISMQSVRFSHAIIFCRGRMQYAPTEIIANSPMLHAACFFTADNADIILEKFRRLIFQSQQKQFQRGRSPFSQAPKLFCEGARGQGVNRRHRRYYLIGLSQIIFQMLLNKFKGTGFLHAAIYFLEGADAIRPFKKIDLLLAPCSSPLAGFLATKIIFRADMSHLEPGPFVPYLLYSNYHHKSHIS